VDRNVPSEASSAWNGYFGLSSELATYGDTLGLRTFTDFNPATCSEGTTPIVALQSFPTSFVVNYWSQVTYTASNAGVSQPLALSATGSTAVP
jgi:hypothetical protein